MSITEQTVTRVLILTYLIMVPEVRTVSSCTKGTFHKIPGERGKGHLLAEVSGTSFDSCLRMCRLMLECYRFNFEESKADKGGCQLLTHFTVLTDDADWSYFVHCPDGMDYRKEVGSCYALTATRGPFSVGIERCAGMAAGAHATDIYSELENDICAEYFKQTGGISIYIGAWRSENDTTANAYFWITTGQPLSFEDWGENRPTKVSDRQCVIMDPDEDVISWVDTPCTFNYYMLCEI